MTSLEALVVLQHGWGNDHEITLCDLAKKTIDDEFRRISAGPYVYEYRSASELENQLHSLTGRVNEAIKCLEHCDGTDTFAVEALYILKGAFRQ